MKGTDVFKQIEESPNFPKIPKELTDIINMLQEPERADINEIVRRIQNVENLEFMIINFINSEFFKAPKKVTSLKEAIVFLGMNTMQVIIIAHIVNYLFPKNHYVYYNYQKKSYLKHSIGTAVASIAISEWLGEGNKYELFAYGVLHDVGVVLYEICIPEAMEKVQEMLIRGCHHIVAERIIFGGIDHTDIGTWFCRKLNFPKNISDVIANHHWPNKSTNRNITFDIINIGDYISHIYYRGYLIRRKVEKPINIFMENNSLNVPMEVIERISLNLAEDVEETIKIFKRF